MQKHQTSLNFAPLLEMPPHNVFRLWPITVFLDAANIQRPILSVVAANTTHIISIVRKLVSTKTILSTLAYPSIDSRIRQTV